MRQDRVNVPRPRAEQPPTPPSRPHAEPPANQPRPRVELSSASQPRPYLPPATVARAHAESPANQPPRRGPTPWTPPPAQRVAPPRAEESRFAAPPPRSPSGTDRPAPAPEPLVIPPARESAPPRANAAPRPRGPKGGPKVYLHPDGSPVVDARHRAARPTPEPAAEILTPTFTGWMESDPILDIRTEPPPVAPRHTLPTTSRVNAAPATPRVSAEPTTLPWEAPVAEVPEGTCPVCRGAGFLRLDVPYDHPRFGKAIVCACRERTMTQRRREDLWRLSNLDAFEGMSFESFDHRAAPGLREAWTVARDYAHEPNSQWLLLSGTCGGGKTHLAAAIAREQFQQGTLVLFTIVPQLLDHLRRAFAPTSNTTYDALFEKVLEAGLLVLDDLGAEHSTAWAQEKLFQIINHRYIYSMPTVITTNQRLDVLEDRIRSRLNDIKLVRHVALQAPDHRPRNAPRRGGAS